MKGNNIGQFLFYLSIWIVCCNRRSKGRSSNRNDLKQGEDKTEVVHVQPSKNDNNTEHSLSTTRNSIDFPNAAFEKQTDDC